MWNDDKLKRLQQAIDLGFIIKSVDDDGTVRYTLTPLGMHQWFMETTR